MGNDQTTDVYIDFDQPESVGIVLESSSDIGIDFDGSTPFAANYEVLANKPSIEGTVLIGNRTLPQIGVGLITEQDIDNMIYG